MFETLHWDDKPTYFLGRNGTYSQRGVEVSAQPDTGNCKDNTTQPAILLQPISAKGIARCAITVPVAQIDNFIELLLKAKEALPDERGATYKVPLPVGKAS